MLKSKTALVFAAVGLVLTFVITVGKVIAPGALVARYLVNTALFYGMGLGVVYLFRRYLLPVLKQAEEQKTELSDILSASRTEAPGKGGRLDLTVDGPAVPSSPAAEGAPADGAPAEAAAGADAKDPAKNPLGPHTDFEIRDDFIVINDKKMPNDPKLMASAIKTKLEE